MKWLSALILTGILTMGCRSSQPATNPFLRTTVPPPATGGAVVVQGEPYIPPGAPAGAPQVIAPTVPTTPPYAPPPYTPPPMTPFTPAAPPPGAVSPPIVAPPVVAPMPAGPPMVAPPKDKYSPPGGSFQYNQSSVQPLGPQGVVPAGYQQPGSPRLRAAIASWTAAQPAPAAESKTEPPRPSRPPASSPAPAKPVSPTVVAAASSTSGSAIRIGGGTKAPTAAPAAKPMTPPAAAASEAPAIDPEAARVVDEVNRQQRQAAGNAAFKEVSRGVAPSGTSQLAIVTPDTVSDTTERFSPMAP